MHSFWTAEISFIVKQPPSAGAARVNRGGVCQRISFTVRCRLHDRQQAGASRLVTLAQRFYSTCNFCIEGFS